MSITYEVRDGVAFVGFNRPDKHNAFRDEDLAELIESLQRFDAEHDAQIAILFGHGRSFSSGGDVDSRLQASMDEGSTEGRTTERDVFLHSTSWKPVIAAVHGYCLGHALSTALLCDHLVASRDARFQVTETKIGFPVPALVPLLGNPPFAHDVAMTGRFFTAEEAWSAGMVTRLVDAGTHLDAAEALAREILDNPQSVVRAYVRARREGVAATFAQHANASAGVDWTSDPEARRAVAERAAKFNDR